MCICRCELRAQGRHVLVVIFLTSLQVCTQESGLLPLEMAALTWSSEMCDILIQRNAKIKVSEMIL